MRRICGGLLIALLCAQMGCATMRTVFTPHKPYTWNKPWGDGAAVPAVICGLIGAGIGAIIEGEIAGHTTYDYQNPPPDSSNVHIKLDDGAKYWRGALIGGAAGAAICGGIGHGFFDEAPAPAPTPIHPTIAALEPPPPAPEPAKKRIVLRGVQFDYNRADIRSDSAPVLDEAALLITTTPEIEMVAIEGHTDSRGTDDYNEALSLRRADAVFRYLVNKDVPPERLQTKGYGESQPVADNDTDSGRAQNRRVELRVLGAAPN